MKVEASAASAYPPHYPHDGTYADLLAWHLEYWGTRAGGNTTFNGLPWKKGDFRLTAFDVDKQDAARTGLNNWLGAKGAPNETNHSFVSKALFGDKAIFKAWRNDLDDARERCPEGKNARTRWFPEPSPPPATQSHPIPRPTPYFMGRDDDVTALAALLVIPTGPAAVLIQGGPGIGKTELTKAGAHHPDVIARYGGRQWFIQLANATTASEMSEAIILGLGCDPQYGFPAALSALKEHPSLIILDNLETPWFAPGERQAVAGFLADISAAPNVSLLASIRGAEFVEGVRWDVRSLDELSALHAVELFSSIAGQWVRDDPHLSNFMGVLGGVPLAIDLVARRAHGCTALAALWDEWLRIGTEFAKRPGLDAGPQTSLFHSIELSLEYCRRNSVALRLFSLLGDLAAGLDLEDLKHIFGEDAFEAEECLRTLGLTTVRPYWIELSRPLFEHARKYYEADQKDIVRYSIYLANLHLGMNITDGKLTITANGVTETYEC